MRTQTDKQTETDRQRDREGRACEAEEVKYVEYVCLLDMLLLLLLLLLLSLSPPFSIPFPFCCYNLTPILARLRLRSIVLCR